MYLLVTAAGKYWRINYRFNEKRKTLALGVYPTVSLAEARKRREKARELLSKGIDPNAAKREEKQVKADLAANTFELVARAWLKRLRLHGRKLPKAASQHCLSMTSFHILGFCQSIRLAPVMY
jgi:hypothetical protein